ncbi:MAG: DUF445 domain-containing protein [Pseudomonadota bacterium]
MSGPQSEPGLSERQRRARLRRMQWIAHGLLLAMLALYVVAGLWQPHYPWLGYVRAFAEAGAVGALADWFAVTALFREPLGLPIPHTAIIKRRKNDIGDTLAEFIGTHFLNRENLAPRLARIDPVGVASDWLARPKNARRLTDDVARVLQRVVRTGDNRALRQLVKDNLRGTIEQLQVTPMLGRLLEMLLRNDPEDTLVGGLVSLAQQQFDDNRQSLRDTVGERTPWWLPGFVDERIYRQLVSEVEQVLSDDEQGGEQRAREHLRRVLLDIVHALKYDEALIDRGERLKQELLDHPQLAEYLSRMVTDISSYLTREAENPDSEFRQRITDALSGLGRNLSYQTSVRDEMNASLRDVALYAITRYQRSITQVIADTIHGWDADTAASLIELRVGRDLQFIRINGTIVGGLAGLTLYTLWHAFVG